MKPGVRTDPKIKSQALAFYEETGTIVGAAERMAEEGVPVDSATIYRWGQTVDGFISRLQSKRRESLADDWYGIAKAGVKRASKAMETLKDKDVTVPAAIATDKFILLTKESPTSTAPAISVFVGVKVND